ncbi:unnamed protein product, partial [Polarella glacialis]
VNSLPDGYNLQSLRQRLPPLVMPRELWQVFLQMGKTLVFLLALAFSALLPDTPGNGPLPTAVACLVAPMWQDLTSLRIILVATAFLASVQLFAPPWPLCEGYVEETRAGYLRSAAGCLASSGSVALCIFM